MAHAGDITGVASFAAAGTVRSTGAGACERHRRYCAGDVDGCAIRRPVRTRRGPDQRESASQPAPVDEASREYARALSLDPPRTPSAGELETIRRFAPRVYTTPAESFPLKDAAAVLHPSERLIAYHLFWEDDIDFPDDNDPATTRSSGSIFSRRPLD